MNITAIGLTEFGGPEVLHLVELPQPTPGRGQVRIRVAFAGLNPTDATFRSGGRAAQLESKPRPYIPGMDLAGTIDAVGEDVDDRLHVGEQVIALVLPFAETRGAYTTSIVVDQRSVVHAPGGWTMPEAATLLLNGVTATLALDAVALPAGDVVGITGASGAVGTYALALAKKRNLVVVADSRPGSEQSLSEHGADVVIDRGAGFATKVRERFPEGLDGLIDTASLNEAALPAVADNGAIASLKGWSGPGERGIRVEPLSAFGAVTDTSLLQQVRDHAADRTLQPHVAEVIPAERAAEAHERLAHGGLNGRLVLDLSNL